MFGTTLAEKPVPITQQKSNLLAKTQSLPVSGGQAFGSIVANEKEQLIAQLSSSSASGDASLTASSGVTSINSVSSGITVLSVSGGRATPRNAGSSANENTQQKGADMSVFFLQ